jgi:Zn-dependent M28 family amino/carboxypeptidase
MVATGDVEGAGPALLASIEAQLALGPRHIGSDGHRRLQQYIRERLRTAGVSVHVQTWQHDGLQGEQYTLTNIVARLHPELSARVLFGAHYDIKRHAHEDSDAPDGFVPGANDGASGVAVLLGIAEVLAQASTTPQVGVDLVFFDGEEGEPTIAGDFSLWQPLGSQYFATHVTTLYGQTLPRAGVVLDMVCDRDLEFLQEGISLERAPEVLHEFWRGAQTVSSAFSILRGPMVLDDHVALNDAGIPSIVVIDFTYPYWHTTEDTLDKCAASSLEQVLRASLAFIYAQ